jgi:cytosine/adenosine deaminase-related metal-dependent hydrolase
MKRTLVRCGWLVSMDARIGDLKDAELLIEDDRILAVGAQLGASADQTVDALDRIVMPGLVNAHIHTWQAGLRGIGGEWMGADYHATMHANLATRFTPEDNYLGNLVGALAQIDNGVTTILDWCHNLTSLEHAERSLDGLEESGIRAVFGHGTAKPPTPPGGIPYTHVPHPRQRVMALRKGRLASDAGRVTLALAILGPHWGTWDVFTHDLGLARELGLLSTSHATKRNADCVAPTGYLRAAAAGLLGPDHNVVHANYVEDDELAAIVGSGASVTATALVELHGHAADPVTARVRALGGLPSLGVDVEPVVTGELLREMQAALLYARATAHRENARQGRPPLPAIPVRSREALEWVTLGGARALGLENRIGSLAPGKKADLVMLRATDLNLFPVHDPVLSIVEQAHGGNVDTVMIDGVFRKRDGRLTVPADTLRRRQRELAESAARILREGGYVPRAR